MTSANVTMYYIYRNGTKIEEIYQNHLCIDRVRSGCEAIEKPEECTINWMWMDEHEVPQYGTEEPLTEMLQRYITSDAKYKASWERFKIKRGKEIQEATGLPLERCIEEYAKTRNVNLTIETLLKEVKLVPTPIVEELYIWLKASINCKEFLWSPDQKEAAEYAIEQYEQFKEKKEINYVDS